MTETFIMKKLIFPSYHLATAILFFYSILCEANDSVSLYEISPHTSTFCAMKLKRGKVCSAELRHHYNNFSVVSTSSCAKGVRQSLNVLFGKYEDYGESKPKGTHALSYNENVLAKWQTKTQHFIPIPDPGKKYKDFDIRVMQPLPTCSNKDAAIYGHIELYYNGTWYSDFKQAGSAWENNHKSKCYKSMTIYRLTRK
jgi:hypothetical protein